MQVEVIFFNQDRGWGLCRDVEDGEQLFLHVNGLTDPSQAALLNRRVRLECDSELDPRGKGWRAVNASVIFEDRSDEHPLSRMKGLIVYGEPVFEG